MLNENVNKSAPHQTPKGKSPQSTEPPCVFDFTDYRKYLAAFYADRVQRNPHYNQSAFARRAGLGANSRGYLKLVIEGKRNLSPHTTRAFIDALGLGGKESIFFENLVNFNQARTTKDKDYYFERLSASVDRGREQFELLQSQYSYFSKWHLVAIRELVALADFNEDPAWIASRLRNKITKKEAQEALTHLLRLELVRRNEKGCLVQSEPLVKFSGGVFNSVIQKLHSEMLDRAKEALVDDDYNERAASFVTLSCNYKRLAEIKVAINEFRDQLTLKFGTESETIDTVFQVGFQLFQITPVKQSERKRTL